MLYKHGRVDALEKLGFTPAEIQKQIIDAAQAVYGQAFPTITSVGTDIAKSTVGGGLGGAALGGLGGAVLSDEDDAAKKWALILGGLGGGMNLGGSALTHAAARSGNIGHAVPANLLGSAVGGYGGLRAGSALTSDKQGSYKQGNIAKLPTALMRNTAMKAAPAASAPVPRTFGGALNRGSSGMFDKVDAAAKQTSKRFNPKQTLRGEPIPDEMPPISIIPAAG